jgi:hypothetical protein
VSNISNTTIAIHHTQPFQVVLGSVRSAVSVTSSLFNRVPVTINENPNLQALKALEPCPK